MNEPVDDVRNSPMQDNVVPAYPFYDALLSLFHNSLVDSNGQVLGSTSRKYNTNLFLPRTQMQQGPAAALACLFENIILAPKMAELPDMETHTKDKVYYHPDLRVQMSWEGPPQFRKYATWLDTGNDDSQLYSEWDHLEGIAMELRRLRPIKEFFRRQRGIFSPDSYIYHKGPRKLVISPDDYNGLACPHALLIPRRTVISPRKWQELDFTVNTVAQLHLACKHNAVLLGDSVFHEFYRLLLKEAKPGMELFPVGDPPKLQKLDLEDVRALSLDFAPASIDAFAEIRMDKEIREYGKNWRRILATSHPEDLRANLYREMAHAYQSSNIARRVRGILSVTGTILTWVGLAPILSAVSGIAGATVDSLSRAAGRIERRSNWCMVGSKMQSVATRASLKQYLSKASRDR